MTIARWAGSALVQVYRDFSIGAIRVSRSGGNEDCNLTRRRRRSRHPRIARRDPDGRGLRGHRRKQRGGGARRDRAATSGRHAPGSHDARAQRLAGPRGAPPSRPQAPDRDPLRRGGARVRKLHRETHPTPLAARDHRHAAVTCRRIRGHARRALEQRIRLRVHARAIPPPPLEPFASPLEASR